ncbi:hypothetical protein BHE74_00021983 [Ensete ventricosum]|nr:hypothetical protein BHE74_00021983 [Ensete ventricosum]
MLHWVGATIICFQHKEAEVLRDGYVLRESLESEESVSRSGRLRINALGVDVRHLIAPGSLNRRQYRPRVWEGGFASLNKGSRGGGCGATPEACYVTEGTSSPRLPGAKRYCDIRPSF